MSCKTHSVALLITLYSSTCAMGLESTWLCKTNSVTLSFDQSNMPLESINGQGSLLLKFAGALSSYKMSYNQGYMRCEKNSDLSIDCSSDGLYLYLNTSTNEGSVSLMTEETPASGGSLMISPINCNLISEND